MTDRIHVAVLLTWPPVFSGEARKEFVRCVRIVGYLALVKGLVDFEEGVFEEGTCVAHVCLSSRLGHGIV
jgi:hypothetical protein